jgi:hypothetical protein
MMQKTQHSRLWPSAISGLFVGLSFASLVAVPCGAAADEPTQLYAQRTTRSASTTSASDGDSKKVDAATMALDSSSEDGEGLEIRGQTRTLSMMLVLQSRRDKIDFIKPRTDYRNRILQTEY